jgi:uncharacterized protein (DUF305 family)
MRKLALIVSTAAVLVTGCSGGSTTPAPTQNPTGATSSSSEGRPSPDVTFAKSLATGHGQVIELAVLAPTRSKNPKVIVLAERVRQLREPQIDQLTGWLAGQNEQLPSVKPADGGEPVKKLRSVPDTEFDKAWAAAVIEQNQATLTIAEAQNTGGTDVEMNDLAKSLAAELNAENTDLRAVTG